MGLIRTSCAYCGSTGVDDKCSQCGAGYHAECANRAGDLRKEGTKGIIFKKTVYHMSCPNCPNHGHVTA